MSLLTQQDLGEVDEILTTAEAAKLLKRGRTTMEALRRRGGGPPFLRLGYNCIRYERTRLLEWVRSKEFASNHVANNRERLLE